MRNELTLLGFTFSPVDLLVLGGLPLGVTLGLYFLTLYLLRRFILKPLKIDEPSKQRAFRVVRLILRAAVLVALLLVGGTFLGTEMARFLTSLWRVLTNPFYAAGSTQISIVTVVMMIPVFYIGTWISKVIMRFVDSAVLSNLTIAEETRFTISILLRNLIMVVAVVVGLSTIGIDLSALSILFGVLGIGLGFGLQGNVANFFAGLTLIFERPIKEGDLVLVGGVEGNVERVRLRSTVINTLTNETIIVPNRKLVEDNIHNYSYGDPRIVIINRVQVSYATDLDEAMDILLLVNEANPYALPSAAIEVRIVDFQDSGILMELRTWIKEARDRHQAQSWVYFEIWRRFKQAGVVIPFPQRDVHLKEMPAGGGIRTRTAR